MTTRIAIIDSALVSIGGKPLQSEAARGAASRIIEYDSVCRDLIARNDWSFASKTLQLGATVEVPPRRWSKQYQLPGDMVSPPRATWSDADTRVPLIEFELATALVAGIDAAVLWTDEATVWLRYTAFVSPLLWPAYFQLIVRKALMSTYALSVREDRTLSKDLKNEVYGSDAQAGDGGLLAEARMLDAQAKPAPVVGRFVSPLVAVRRGGRRDWSDYS